MSSGDGKPKKLSLGDGEPTKLSSGDGKPTKLNPSRQLALIEIAWRS
jgi:hypothetical protein